VGDFDDREWYKFQMHAFLMTLTSRSPHALIDNFKDEGGMKAWHSLHLEFANTTPEGKRALLGRVLQHPKAKGYDDLLGVQSDFMRAVAKHEEATGEKMKTDIKATAYINILPEKVAENMRTLEKELTTIEDLQVYVRKQYAPSLRPSRSL
jgi:hypothetical protein